MSISNGCNTLRDNRVPQNDSGVRIDPDAECEVYVRDKSLVDLCLNCEKPECSFKVRDDIKQMRMI